MINVRDASQLAPSLAALNVTLERLAKNLNHLTLPEIKDFNALGDTRCVRYFVKRFKARRVKPHRSVIGTPCARDGSIRRGSGLSWAGQCAFPVLAHCHDTGPAIGVALNNEPIIVPRLNPDFECCVWVAQSDALSCSTKDRCQRFGQARTIVAIKIRHLCRADSWTQ